MTQRTVYEEVLRYLVQTEGGRELTTLANQLITLGESGDKSAAQAKALATELQRLQETTGKIRDFTRLKASINETNDELEKARTRMHAVAEEIRTTEKPTAKLQREMSRAAAEVEKLSKQQNRQQVELQKTAGALRSAGVDTEKLAEASDKLQGQLLATAQRGEAVATAAKSAGKETRGAAGDVGKLDKAAGASAKSLAALAGRLTAISAAVSVALKGLTTLSGTALFSGGLRSATELEQALSEVRAVSGATAEELEAMKAAAEAGGGATKFSALEAAQGLGELARATGSAQTAIEALPATLDLAQAAGLGVAQAAEFVTTTLTQYGLAADQASRVSDVLAQAANVTTADVTGLGNALSYAAPLAKLLGIDLEGTAAIIGAMADQGFRGERAGTALRNVFSEMLDPASDFGKALRELGIESSDFITVIEQLGEKGARGQEALLKLDAAARPAILALVNSGSSALRQLDGDLRNAAGSANETAKVMNDSLSGAAEQIRDSFDRTRRSLVEPLLEPLKQELVGLATELEEFAQSPEFEEIKVALQETFIEGAAAARELVENIDFAELARKIRAAMTDAGETMAAFRENIGLVIDAVMLIGRTFDVVFNAVQAAVLGIAAVVTKLASVFFTVQDAITGPYRAVLEFMGLIEEGQGDLSDFAGGLGAVADEFRERFTTNTLEAWEATQRLGGAATETGRAAAEGLGAAAGAAEAAATTTGRLEQSAEGAAAALDREAAAAGAAAGATSQAAAEIDRSAERLKQAFADMGIESQAELKRAADAAKANFQLIREAIARGEATAEDGRRAFAKYAEAMRASVAESDAAARFRVEAELEVQQAILGSTDALGTMASTGVSAHRQISAAASSTASSYNALASAASGASGVTGGLGDAARAAGGGLQAGGQAAGGMKIALQQMSEEAVQSLLALNRLAGTKLWATAWNRQMERIDEQRQALGRMNEELDRQLASMDPLAKRVQQLKLQYGALDEELVRNIAEKEQRVDEELKRKRDAALQERQRILDEAQASADREPAGPTRSTLGGDPRTRRVVTLRLETPTGDTEVLETTEEGLDAAQMVLDVLGRSQSTSQLRRRR